MHPIFNTRKKGMMTIGITGGIGSGKSTLAAELKQLGYFVYDTDREAKRIITEDKHVREQIIALFGEESFTKGAKWTYNTQFVADKVFQDKTLLKKLNGIVHPAVKTDIENCRQRSEIADNSSYFFIECAILYEAGLDRLCDKIVVVSAPAEVRIARTIARDKSNEAQVRARIRAQKKDADLKGDILINNDGKTPIRELAQQLISQL